VEALEERALLSVFGVQTPFAVSGVPYSVAVGDFNRDSIPDLAVANNSSSNAVSVLLGNGSGGFGTAVNYTVGSGPFSVAVGDFNRDGYADLAVANLGSNTVSVLFGNGSGGFGTAVNYTVGSGPISVAVGDFNRDGNPDLAVANSNSNTVSVLLGNGFGGFGTAVNYTVGSVPYSVAVGDFNRDGYADLAVANLGSNTVSVLQNDKSGKFLPAVNYTAGTGPVAVAVGDFDNTGVLSLVVANYYSNTVSVLRGPGNGSFTVATTVSVGTNPFSVAVGDFNRDGLLDVAVANSGSNSVSVLQGLGAGTFVTAAVPVVNPGPMSVAMADLTQDGYPDLVTANNTGSVSVVLNTLPVTTTTVNANFSSPVFGQLVGLTATVTHDPLTGIPQGIVSFRDGKTILGTATLNYSGQATLTTPALAVGYHAITAVYLGNPNLATSTSPILNLGVNQAATATALSASANAALFGQPVTFTAAVSAAAPGGGVPTGSVVFTDGAAILGTVPLNPSTGIATFTATALSASTHSINAIYVGDGNFTGSPSTTVTLQVNNATPTVTSVGPTSVAAGSAAFTLTIVGTDFLPGSTVQWSGTGLTVTALSGTQIQATVPASLLIREGTATVTVTNPGPGGGMSLAKPFTIADAPITASARELSVTGNKAFSGVVATFTDANFSMAAGDFTAIITWDDGTSKFGTITGSAGSFSVSGAHTFQAFSNVHPVTVTIRDRAGNTVAVTDDVIDPPAPAAIKPKPAPQPPKPAPRIPLKPQPLGHGRGS